MDLNMMGYTISNGNQIYQDIVLIKIKKQSANVPIVIHTLSIQGQELTKSMKSLVIRVYVKENVTKEI